MSRLLLIFLAPLRKVIRRKVRQDESLVQDLRESVRYSTRDYADFLAYLDVDGEAS